MPDLDTAAVQLAAALSALGLDADPETARSGARMASLLATFTPQAPPPVSVFHVANAGTVAMRAIPFHSMCAHHFVPFFGQAEIVYEPAGVVAGLGSLHATVAAFARRPQLQERMAAEIADHLFTALRPRRLAVRLVARQMCLELRDGGFGVEITAVACRGEHGAADLLA